MKNISHKQTTPPGRGGLQQNTVIDRDWLKLDLREIGRDASNR